jgi:hypothetical protein
LGEDAVRECLAAAGLTAIQPGSDGNVSGFAPLANPPDFVLYDEAGTSVGVDVHGTDEKAERAAADLKGAIQSVGGADRREVLAEKNVVVTFGATPSEQTRDTVEGCLN